MAGNQPLTARTFLKKIFFIRNHIIMRTSVDNDALPLRIESSLALEKVREVSQLVDGTYSVKTQERLMRRNLGLCVTFLLKNIDNDYVIGIASIMFVGGANSNTACDILKRELKARSIGEVYLAVSKENVSAINAYTKSGFQIVAERLFVRVLKYIIPYYIL